MATASGAGVTGSQPPVAGRVAGAVLAAIRDHVGLTQVALAQTMGVTRDTVQGWESGRRPLMNLKYTQLGKLRRVLQLAKATSTQLAVLSEALQADMIFAEIAVPEPDMHPLALVVPNRMLTELLSWPFTGRPPRQLAETRARLDVRPGERDELAAALRRVTNRADRGVAGAMLRRQTQYLIVEHPGSAEWVAESSAADVRAAHDIREWSPEWAVTRSRAISAASRGNLEPLQRFIEHGLSDDQAAAANLRYWAYWVGEIPHPWSSDTDMLTDGQPWSGELLLGSLLDGLESAPYRDLCAHAVHTLLRQRRALADQPGWHRRLADVLERVTAEDDLAVDARRKLEQVAYAIGA